MRKKPEIEKLKILQFLGDVHAVSTTNFATNVDWKAKFPKVFDGLGEMPGTYHITLTPDAIPFAIHCPRRVPLPLLPKVKEELDKMVKSGVIEEVNEPSKWIAPMHVVQKGIAEKSG